MQIEQLKHYAYKKLKQTGIVLREDEIKQIEIADFGLNEFETTGLMLYTYENNDRYCAKELILLANQTCPEHKHPPVFKNNQQIDIGKRETFRCRQGKVYLYVEGLKTEQPQTQAPKGSQEHYSVFHEISMQAGDQYTIEPNTLHWFKSGSEGAIVTEFSSSSRDELDIFTDPRIKR